jgi:hypothetical protein
MNNRPYYSGHLFTQLGSRAVDLLMCRRRKNSTQDITERVLQEMRSKYVSFCELFDSTIGPCMGCDGNFIKLHKGMCVDSSTSVA